MVGIGEVLDLLKNLIYCNEYATNRTAIRSIKQTI